MTLKRKTYFKTQQHDNRRKRCKKCGDDTGSEGDHAEHIKYKGNHIYFYTPVNRSTLSDFYPILQKMNKYLLNSRTFKEEIDSTRIYLHVSSDGGDPEVGLVLMDIIKASQVPVIAIIEGVVASAATIMVQGAYKRFITRNSFMLIHQISHSIEGTTKHLKDEMSSLKLTGKAMRNVYLQNTRLSKKRLKRLLKRDITLGSKKCIKYGLVDAEVTYPLK